MFARQSESTEPVLASEEKTRTRVYRLRGKARTGLEGKLTSGSLAKSRRAACHDKNLSSNIHRKLYQIRMLRHAT